MEGGPVEGLRVLLMDDLTTDGNSKLGFARGLKAAGADVQHVLTIFYHDAFPGARERLDAAGLTLHALATWADVLNADHGGRLTRGQRRVERFSPTRSRGRPGKAAARASTEGLKRLDELSAPSRARALLRCRNVRNRASSRGLPHLWRLIPERASTALRCAAAAAPLWARTHRNSESCS